MNLRLLGTVFALTFLCSYAHQEFRFRNPIMLTGAIQFPKLKKLPDIRAYRLGQIIDFDKEPKRSRLVYSIMDDRSQIHYFILITNAISFATADNTVKYIKINPEQPYKLYLLTLKEIAVSDTKLDQSPRYSWIIKELTLPPDGRIPDNSLIICYDPCFVKTLHGGNNGVELPTIVIDPDIVATLGSEQALLEKSAELLLATLEYDTVHAHSKQEIKLDFARKTVMTLTT